MHNSYTTDEPVAESRTTWHDENSRGVFHAGASAWTEAAAAFSAALETISSSEPSEPVSHDALALVLGNLAGACFHAGRPDEGIRHAQRACALRVALVGEDAVAVARARSDLAVMLCATGRADEASALIGRAIAGIERSAGDEDARLIPVLENAARVAMVLAQPASAEPYLLRMHALLAAHDLPVSRAEALLARVAEARGARGVCDSRAPESPAAAPDLLVAAPVAVDQEWQRAELDEPPVAQQEQAMEQDEQAMEQEEQAIEQPYGGVELEIVGVLPLPTPDSSPSVHGDSGASEVWSSAYAEAFTHDSLELMEPSLDPLPPSALGFSVQHGFTGYEEQHHLGGQSMLGAELELTDLPEPAYAQTAPAQIATVDGAVAAAQYPLAVVVDAERSTPAVSFTYAPDPQRAPAGQDEVARDRRPFATALRTGRAATPQRSRGVLIGVVVTLATGAAAAWFRLQGGQ